MEEDRRERWDFDKRIRDNTIAGLRATSRAAELGNMIDRRAWRERADTYFGWLSQATAAVIAEVADAQVLLVIDRQRWCQRLAEIDLRSSRAATEFGEVLLEVQAKQRFWGSLSRDFNEVGPPERPVALGEPPKPGESLGAVELMLKRQDAERKRKLEDEATENERALGSMVSALEHAITLHEAYELARSRS